jgi:hypothetical protein
MRKLGRVIIWGHPLGSHTHSYIHGSFYKAFKSMGYDSIWTNNPRDLDGLDLRSSLFLTESQEDHNIPLIKGAHYILHNTDSRKYLDAGCKAINIQVICKKTYNFTENTEIINSYTFFEPSSSIGCLYLPWATDLLPEEINLDSAKNNSPGECVWVGTYGGGSDLFENGSQLDPFFQRCRQNGIKVNQINPWGNPVSFEENRRLVNGSYLSPSIQGKWQVSVGYLPCRIFKNISYGHMGYTNSDSVNEIFNGEVIYDSDPSILFQKSIESKGDPSHIERLKYLMNEVKNNHTYVNRIKDILNYLPE